MLRRRQNRHRRQGTITAVARRVRGTVAKFAGGVRAPTHDTSARPQGARASTPGRNRHGVREARDGNRRSWARVARRTPGQAEATQDVVAVAVRVERHARRIRVARYVDVDDAGAGTVALRAAGADGVIVARRAKWHPDAAVHEAPIAEGRAGVHWRPAVDPRVSGVERAGHGVRRRAARATGEIAAHRAHDWQFQQREQSTSHCHTDACLGYGF